MSETIKLRLHYKGREITDTEIREAMTAPHPYGAMRVDGVRYHVDAYVPCIGDEDGVAADVWLEEMKNQ